MLAGWAGSALANPGDTTWVQAHNDVHLDWYNNFDTTVAFPDGSASYRKISMTVTLGKYQCPAGSQWCGDWDYTVQLFLMTKTGDTMEIGRLITPYANASYPRTPWSWRERYIFDVTDYYHLLKDTATVRLHYSGYSGGFTADVKFAFVEGTRDRDVVGIDRLWHGNFNYGHGNTPINTALAALSKTMPGSAVSTELKMNITGHGGDDNACAEFCPNQYAISLNGTQLLTKNFFRTDCDRNNLYPQSGTWIYSRANWCPGALVHTITHPLQGLAGAYNLGMSFPAYTSTTVNGGGPASYTIEAAAVYYGAMNKSLDVSVDDIVAPTNAEYHFRQNPTSRAPIITVHNGGSTTINSIKFEYGVTGMGTQTYTWTAGNLAALQTMDIHFPPMAGLKLNPASYTFHVKVLEVNGVADDDMLNNELSSTFNAAPALPSGIIVKMKSNEEGRPGNNSISQTSWRIEDANGTVVAYKGNCPVNTICTDTVQLNFGEAYRFIISDSAQLGYWDINQNSNTGVWQGTGLAGYSSIAGYVRLFNAANNGNILIPMYYGGNFGGGFSFDFFTGFANAVNDVNHTDLSLIAYPNPARDHLSFEVNGSSDAKGYISLINMMGQEVITQPYLQGTQQIDVSHLAGGVYQLIYHNERDQNMRLMQRVVITH